MKIPGAGGSIFLTRRQGNLETPYYMATAHRAEKSDDGQRLWNMMESLDKIAEDTPVLLPLHPRTRERLKLTDITIRDIKLLESIDYFDVLCCLTVVMEVSRRKPTSSKSLVLRCGMKRSA